MLGDRGQLTGKDRHHQHRVNQTAWMPRDVEDATLIGEVFIVNDVDFSEPDVG